MVRAAILPSNPDDPTGQDALERAAMKEFKRRIKHIVAGYVELLGRIPSELVINRRYVFRLDSALLTSLLAEADFFVDSVLLDGGDRDLWFFTDYVAKAYQRGTAMEYANLVQQSPAYAAETQSLSRVLTDEAYRRRIDLIRAREFEEMKGFAGSVKADMSRVLTDGIARGLNPRDIARNLAGQGIVDINRANRIAQTEITTALRRARWDEHDESEVRYGIKSMLLHMSALTATSRVTHMARHGKLFTSEEVRDWYSIDANPINCKCAQTSVTVDADGNPESAFMVKRMAQMRERSKEDLESNQQHTCIH